MKQGNTDFENEQIIRWFILPIFIALSVARIKNSFDMSYINIISCGVASIVLMDEIKKKLCKKIKWSYLSWFFRVLKIIVLFITCKVIYDECFVEHISAVESDIISIIALGISLSYIEVSSFICWIVLLVKNTIKVLK